MFTRYQPDSDASLTRTLAGHALTLTPGRRYLACRPLGKTRGPVTVRIEDLADGSTVANVAALTFDQANELLAAFNNEATSFTGRLWK